MDTLATQLTISDEYSKALFVNVENICFKMTNKHYNTSQ